MYNKHKNNIYIFENKKQLKNIIIKVYFSKNILKFNQIK